MEFSKKIQELRNKLNFTHVPHITLGRTDNEHEKICLNDKFKTIVDRIFVESIGENEESNIEFEIVLK
jgi:2'-5' RNA ligase